MTEQLVVGFVCSDAPIIIRLFFELFPPKVTTPSCGRNVCLAEIDISPNSHHEVISTWIHM